jgi:hypothetical protein
MTLRICGRGVALKIARPPRVSELNDPVNELAQGALHTRAVLYLAAFGTGRWLTARKVRVARSE